MSRPDLPGTDLLVEARRAPLPVSGGMAEPLAGFAAPCIEVLNLEQPRAVRAVHLRYLQAGARRSLDEVLAAMETVAEAA